MITEHGELRYKILIIAEHTELAGTVSSSLQHLSFNLHQVPTINHTAAELGKQLFRLLIFCSASAGEKQLQNIAQLKAISPGIPLLVVSNDGLTQAVSESFRLGASGYIRGPVVKEELCHVVSTELTKDRRFHQSQLLRQRVENTEKIHQFMLKNTPDLVYVLDENQRFTFVNDRVEELLNIKREELIGSHFNLLVHDEDIRRKPYLFNERRLKPRDAASRELHLKKRLSLSDNADATTLSVPFEIKAIGVYDQKIPGQDPAFRGTFGIATDITDKKQAASLIRFQAYHDLLTGLPNRSLFRDRLTLAISQAKRSNSCVATMYLDIDRFKNINDSLGHNVGDQLIQAAARRISSSLREGDTLSRMGSDEFVLLTPNIKSKADAEIIAKKVTQELTSPFYIEDNKLYLTASIGISVFPEDALDADHLVQNADLAMRHAKASGKNRFSFFNAHMGSACQAKFNLEQDLRNSIENHELFLEYQPIYEARSLNVHGLEVYVRWHHPQQGIIYPKDFLGLAEECGFMIQVGDWVIHQACKDLAGWQNPHLKLSINLSPQQFASSSFESKLMLAVKEHNISPHQIEFDITEQLLANNQVTILTKLKRLRRLGFTFAIDDFGTGFTALGYLHDLAVNTLKLDPSFLRQIPSDRQPDRACPIKAIYAMANSLNLTLVAEGVETMEQREYLQALGCDLVQGHLLQAPVRAESAREFLPTPPAMVDDL